MTDHYKYKCSDCGSEIASNEIENNQIYLCPKCGKLEKNKPLVGVLEIVYDYEEIKSKISKDNFLKNNAGKFWKYPYLWPLKFINDKLDGISETQLNKLSLIENPISEINYSNNSVKIFDDSRNPTLSYKDRASSLVALKAIQLGIKEISAASTGNAGSSLAGICARLGMQSHIFVPKNIPESKRIQIQSFGANLYVVNGDYDQAFDLCLEVSKKKNWYNRNTAFNPLTIEGKKSSVYDMFISMKGNLPENIFAPVGDGVIISGIYKGIKELLKLGWIEKVPKLFAVQSEGSSAVVDYIEGGKFEYKSANTIADSISAGAPRNLYMAAQAVISTNGKGLKVSDEEIISAQKVLCQKFGILAEPAAAASFAGYKKISENKDIQGDSILMITGNGLKDISSLKNWNHEVEIRTEKEWKAILNKKSFEI
ncbi:MAG: pyridoxal-phosphate dependent enzyme [Ignavibacteriae bacterium]|nr:pyridoxal-phosphate dependent enzyme [Ignavibacteriota bacterium]